MDVYLEKLMAYVPTSPAGIVLVRAGIPAQAIKAARGGTVDLKREDGAKPSVQRQRRRNWRAPGRRPIARLTTTNTAHPPCSHNILSRSTFLLSGSVTPPLHPQVFVTVFFTYVTSPLAMLHLSVILLRLPFVALRSVTSFLLPSFFWKKIEGEVVYVTGGAGGIGKLMAQKVQAELALGRTHRQSLLASGQSRNQKSHINATGLCQYRVNPIPV